MPHPTETDPVDAIKRRFVILTEKRAALARQLDEIDEQLDELRSQHPEAVKPRVVWLRDGEDAF